MRANNGITGWTAESDQSSNRGIAASIRQSRTGSDLSLVSKGCSNRPRLGEDGGVSEDMPTEAEDLVVERLKS